MRKITFLLTLLLLGLCGSTQSASAAVDWGLSASSLTSITAGQTVVIKECPSSLTTWSENSYMNSGSSSVVASVDYSCLYRFEENGTVTQGGVEHTVYVLYNVSKGQYLAGENSYTPNKADAYQMVASNPEKAERTDIDNSTDWSEYYNKTSLDFSSVTETLWVFCKKDGKSWLTVVGNPNTAAYPDTNLWLIYSVDETKILSASLAAAKESACAKIDALAQQLTTLYTDGASVKSQINAVVLQNNDINAALAEINTLTNNYISSINNKSIIFTNQTTGTDARAGLHITAGNVAGTDMSKAYGTHTTFKNRTIWTIKDNGDGTFKLFNLFSSKYLGAAASAGALSANAADGANFTFVIRGENIVSLRDNAGNIFHQLNYWSPNFGYTNYNTNDPASNWAIESVEIASEELRAQYAANQSKLLGLAYSYQEKYGLVKDASKMSVVVIETEHSGDAKPVSNLIDGNTGTYVHSSYGSDKGTDPHYIQVELSEAQQKIMFYMAQRNGNNRPSTVKVYVSNDGTDFGTEPVATLENLHLLGDPYYSPEIDLGGSYKYVRFVVATTNTSTLYFTASEFYVLPVNEDTQVLCSRDFTGITTEVVEAQYAVLTASTKSEYRAILAACSHAEVPALGEYTTEAYNALQAAVEDDAITPDDLDAVVDRFNRAQNRPVFIFTSANDGAYSANSSIFDNVSGWRFTTKNYYNQSMFFSVKDLTETKMTVGTAYNIYNYVTGRSLYYDGTVTPELVEGKENVFNLKVNTGNGYLHCQSGGALVTWGPCVIKDDAYDCTASSWRIEYVGNTYDFDQMTDFPVAANDLMAINTAMKNNFGTELNKFSAVNTEQLNQAIASVEALQARENNRRYSVTNTEVTSAVAALNSAVEGATMNQPTVGKFYRLKNVASGKYLSSTLTDSKMTMDANGYNTRESVFYLAEGNKLLSYENGLFTQNFSGATAYGFEAADAEGHAVTFASGNPVTAGNPCYHIQCGTRSIYGNSGSDNLDAGNNVAEDNADTGYDWTIEEVKYLPVAVSSTVKYGTLYAPVDLSLRDGLEAFTGTINGEWLHLNPVTDVIPAGTAVVLKDTGAERDPDTNCIYLELASGATAVGENALAGTFKTTATVAGAYTLQNSADGLGFYPFSGETLAGFKAYMLNGGSVRGFKFQEGETTLIEGVDSNAGLDESVYDLSGRRVQNARKGIYIVGGKKVIVK